jgi:hypothetical protein
VKQKSAQSHDRRESTPLVDKAADTPKRETADQRKSTEEFQLSLWSRWQQHELWPGTLDLYEAAAYLRLSPSSIRRATQTDQHGRAALPHQRFRSLYRFRRDDLDRFGRVEGQAQR